MLPLQERSVLLSTLLPDDPEPGQIIRVPEGQHVGGSNVINIFRNNKLIGCASQLTPIQNVTGKYELVRVATKHKLNKNDLILVIAKQFIFTSVIFIESFGWCGYEAPQEHLLLSKHFKIIAAIPVGPQTEGFNLYEKICLNIIKEDKK